MKLKKYFDLKTLCECISYPWNHLSNPDRKKLGKLFKHDVKLHTELGIKLCLKSDNKYSLLNNIRIPTLKAVTDVIDKTLKKRTPRNPLLSEKPYAEEWLNNNLKMYSFALASVAYLEKLYQGDFSGWTDNVPPTYVLGRADGNRITVRLKVNSCKIQIAFPHEQVPKELSKFKVLFSPRVHGDPKVEGVSFVIKDTKSFESLNIFLISAKLKDFSLPTENEWKKVTIVNASSIELVTIHRRAVEAKTVELHELKLETVFVSWLKKSYAKPNTIIRQDPENGHRPDVRFERKDDSKKILTELKCKKSMKYDLDAAIGQLLRYKYFGNGIECDEIWVVGRNEPSEDEIEFINAIVDELNTCLRVAWRVDNQDFKIYPKN